MPYSISFRNAMTPWSNPDNTLLWISAFQQPHSVRFLHIYVCATYNLMNTSRGKICLNCQVSFSAPSFNLGSLPVIYWLLHIFSLSLTTAKKLCRPLSLLEATSKQLLSLSGSLFITYESAISFRGMQSTMLGTCRINFLFSLEFWFLNSVFLSSSLTPPNRSFFAFFLYVFSFSDPSRSLFRSRFYTNNISVIKLSNNCPSSTPGREWLHYWCFNNTEYGSFVTYCHSTIIICLHFYSPYWNVNCSRAKTAWFNLHPSSYARCLALRVAQCLVKE